MDKAITQNPAVPPKGLLNIVLLVEQIDYTNCYITDQGFSRDVNVIQNTLAGDTQSIKVDPSITHSYTRHEIVTAINIVFLDELSCGQAFLGIGDLRLPVSIYISEP